MRKISSWRSERARRGRGYALRRRNLPHVHPLCGTQRWKVEILSSSESSAGGLKEVIAIIEGNRVFSQLKYESGVHRVQRVPATEQQGRFTLLP